MEIREFVTKADSLSAMEVAKTKLNCIWWRFIDDSATILYQTSAHKFWQLLKGQNGMFEIDVDVIPYPRTLVAVTYRFEQVSPDVWEKQSTPISSI